MPAESPPAPRHGAASHLCTAQLDCLSGALNPRGRCPSKCFNKWQEQDELLWVSTQTEHRAHGSNPVFKKAQHPWRASGPPWWPLLLLCPVEGRKGRARICRRPTRLGKDGLYYSHGHKPTRAGFQPDQPADSLTHFSEQAPEQSVRRGSP